MEHLTQYLDQILEWHNRLGTPLSAQLQPGLSADEIRKKIAVLPFKMPEEFIELYMWRNGTPARIQDWVSFISNNRFLPLEEALDIFREGRLVIQFFYKITDWVMTFMDWSGDGYGISAVMESGSTAPVVLLFEGDGVNIVFESLAQMLKTIVASFEAGVFSLGEDGDLDTDFYELGEVAHRLNPNIHYWTQYTSYPKPGG
jgi:cell wall assembly regulator SMI1